MNQSYEYEFTDEESIFVAQLAAIQTQLGELEAEARTHEDRILTILRGHRAENGIAQYDGTRYGVKRVVMEMGNESQTVLVEVADITIGV
jgi:hypothetical protein